MSFVSMHHRMEIDGKSPWKMYTFIAVLSWCSKLVIPHFMFSRKTDAISARKTLETL